MAIIRQILFVLSGRIASTGKKTTQAGSPSELCWQRTLQIWDLVLMLKPTSL